MIQIYMANDRVKYSLIAGRSPIYIVWNHQDKELPIHFYDYRNIYEAKKDECRIKCLYIHESRAIIPKVYDYVLNHEELQKVFDYIFTSDAEILKKFNNARFKPGSGVWYGTKRWGGEWDINRCNLKSKNISILSSYKRRCELHNFRFELAKYYKNSNKVDTFGAFDGGNYVELNVPLDDYRYSIAIENEISPYYFTEKIMNCFASMTVPIYIGATNIGEFFNEDGIIRVDEPTIEAVEKAVAVCNQEDYEKRKDAIIDNYNRVKEYLCVEDYIYKHYKSELFESIY
jgi:hypothetical protein